MASSLLSLDKLVQTAIATVLGIAIHRLWKKIDRIEPLASQVEQLTKAVKHADGTIKGVLKKTQIMQQYHHELTNRVTKLETDMDWVKESK